MSGQALLEKPSNFSPTESQPHSELTQIPGPDTTDLKNSLTKREKWFIVAVIALAAMFSPFTANIYFPAIPVIARAFNKPIELINLTVTVYVVLQGTSPMFWGTMSDSLGRRPIAAACLLLLSLSCVGLALVPTSAYWLLLVLRCFQAAGSASTIALGAGVISDISTPAERGGFYGFFSLGPMVGPALGPVVGGALTQKLGWRAIFWFLCIAVSVCLVVIIALLPETLPGRRHTKSSFRILYTPLIPIIGRKSSASESPPLTAPPSRPKKFQNPFLLFARRDIVLLLLLNATGFSVFFTIATSLSPLFEETYPFLNQLTIGLCFLSTGGGMAIGSAINGRIMDRNYQREKERFKKGLVEAGELEKALGGRDVKDVDKLPGFPLERARLSVLPVMLVVLTVCSAGYGWCIHSRVNIAVPLILQVIMGYTSMAVLNGSATLMIDLVPKQSSTVTACTNLVRCAFSAIIISVIQPLINAIGVGWAYVLISGISVISLPVLFIELKFGPRWRVARLEKECQDPPSQVPVATGLEGNPESRVEKEQNRS